MRSLSLVPLALFAFAGRAQAAQISLPTLSDKDASSLKAALDDVVARTSLARARASILVQGIDDGRIIYSHDADDLLNPASNVKLFTAAAALSRLGPDYRWNTDFLIREPMKPNGEVKDLYVRGNGDPLLTTEKLYEIVGQLYHQGLRNITGNLYIDDTYFDGERVGPGFDQETSDKAYLAPTGALSLNWNSIEIDAFPGTDAGTPARIELEPQSDYFVVDSQATTVAERGRGRIKAKVSFDTRENKQKVEIDGRLPLNKPGQQFWKKVDRPDLYVGYTLKALFQQRGIKIKGRVKAVTTPTPTDAKVLYTYESEPLDLAVRKMDKTSSNFIAEQLIKCLGAEVKGTPGSWEKGIEAVEDFLEEVGLPRGSYVMKNGSGLNDTNRFSAAQVVKLLRYMVKRFNMAPEYLASLGVVGKDGTVRSRMEGTEAAGRIRAKTGTLESVTALSGVVESLGGQHFVFSVLVNDYPGKHAQVNAAIDDLGIAIAAAGGAIDPAQVSKQMVAAAQPQSSPLDELKARVATYNSLGKLANKHNLPFLRTALRTERDPALKVVVADALYRSDPSDGSGARALLDAWSIAPEVWGRLKAVSHDAGSEEPVISSLLDVAAEGNAEAMSRIVELSPQSQGDPALTRELADGLDQISRNAPDELIVSLRNAPPDTSQAALNLLVQGNAASTETKENPLPKAILKAEDGKDPELAAFAKTLEQDYATRLALAKAAAKNKTDAPAPSPNGAPPGKTDTPPTPPANGTPNPVKSSVTPASAAPVQAGHP
jgi:D-alanyl-D-alanine carboxypeptidase/D-alanyl-D-alanine-endopeptidase (penicillin-binding protein 4)